MSQGSQVQSFEQQMHAKTRLALARALLRLIEALKIRTSLVECVGVIRFMEMEALKAAKAREPPSQKKHNKKAALSPATRLPAGKPVDDDAYDALFRAVDALFLTPLAHAVRRAVCPTDASLSRIVAQQVAVLRLLAPTSGADAYVGERVQSDMARHWGGVDVWTHHFFASSFPTAFSTQTARERELFARLF